MQDQENCNRDAAWVVRTLAYSKKGASLTVGEVVRAFGPNGEVCLALQYEISRIACGLAHWIKLGVIRENASGTFTWLGARNFEMYRGEAA